jgi:hypothetical protein
MPPNLRAPNYSLLLSQTVCYHCGGGIPTVALWVPSFEEIDEVDGEVAGCDEPALLKSIEALDARAQGTLQVHAPWLRLAGSHTAGFAYWANHCQMCGALQGDHYLFGVNGPYGPQNEEQLMALKRVDVMGRLEAVAVTVR